MQNSIVLTVENEEEGYMLREAKALLLFCLTTGTDKRITEYVVLQYMESRDDHGPTLVSILQNWSSWNRV